MNIVAQLTIENIKQNRRRTIVTVIGVALSCALIIAVAGMVASFHQMMKDVVINRYGNYHDMFENVPPGAVGVIRNNAGVASYYFGRMEINDETLDDYYSDTILDVEQIEVTDDYDASAEWRGVFVLYKNPSDYLHVREDILDAIGDYSSDAVKIRTNSELMRYEGVMGDKLLRSVAGIATIVIFVIVISSVFVIRNSFRISATERMHQFGTLASIGATSWQIRATVYTEALAVSIMGIIVGSVIGIIADFILVQIVNGLLGEMFTMTNNSIQHISFVMPPAVFIISATLTIVTAFLSSSTAARRAAKMSPVDALRGVQDFKIKGKVHESALVRKLFGIGGVIADKNLRRSRKKYRTTVISIVVSVAIFIGLSSLLSYGKKIISLEYANIPYDISATLFGDDNLRKVRSLPNIEKIYVYQSVSTTSIGITILDRDTFADYAKTVGVVSKDYSNIVILNDYFFENDGGAKILKRQSGVNSGDVVEITILNYSNNTNTKIKAKVTKITDKQPDYIANINYYPTYYISEDYYQRDEIVDSINEGDDYYYIKIASKDADAVAEEIGQIVNKYGGYVDNVSQEARIMRNMYLLISIFLYGFIIVISLIGITNIFNTITTNITLRAKEFAMLRSVGMTNGEFHRMVRLESLLYSLRSLLIGIPIGVALSFLVYVSLTSFIDLGFIVPIGPIIISILAVAILVFAIMSYSVKQVDKQNIIETIRNDNI